MRLSKCLIVWGLVLTCTLSSTSNGLFTIKTRTYAAKDTDIVKEEDTSIKDQAGDLMLEDIPYTKESKEAAKEVLISDIAEEEVKTRSTTINSSGIGDNDYDKYGYSELSDGQKAMYDDFDAAFAAYVNSATYKTTDYNSSSPGYDSSAKVYDAFSLDKKISEYGITADEAMQVYFTYRDNNPEYFWISTRFYQYGSANYYYTVIIDGYYAESAALRSETEAAIVSGINSIKTAANKESGTYNKVKVVHDMIIDQVDYAYIKSGVSASGASDAIWAHSVGGTFVSRPDCADSCEIVCEGYAKTFQLVLQELGIDNIYIVGNAGGAHAWNAVKLEDKEYHCFDVTWDDAGKGTNDGRKYMYFSAPKSFFGTKHTAYKKTGVVTSGMWLYDLPELSDDFNYTYYAKYSSYFANVADKAAATTLLNAAASLAIPSNSRYFHILCKTKSDITVVCQTLGVNSYTPVSGYTDGYGIVTAFMGSYGVTVKATEVKLDKNEAEIDRAKEKLTLTATITPDNSDDSITWSVSGGQCTFSNKIGESTTITFKRAGEYVITATAAAGGVSDTCAVTVTDSGGATHIYVDSGFNNLVTDSEAVLYAGGANKKNKETGVTECYKSVTYYSDLMPVSYKNSKGKAQTGKVIVGVTSTPDEPAVVKNKIPKDPTSKNILSAARKKNGALKLVTKKQSGTVYVWVLSLAGEEVVDVGCVKMTVLRAPYKIKLSDSFTDPVASSAVYKKSGLTLGASTTFYVRSTFKGGDEITEGVDFTAAPAKGQENYISVTPIDNDGFKVTATGLKNHKKTKAKVSIQCVQNKRKATFSVDLMNCVTGAPDIKEGDDKVEVVGVNEIVEGATEIGKYLSYPIIVYASGNATKTVTTSVDITPSLSSATESMTDKPKVYMMAAPDGFTINNKGVVKVINKPVGTVAKIKASIKTTDGKSKITIKTPIITDVTTYVLVVYNTYKKSDKDNNYGYFVIPVNVQ
ncbi:MAG: hypothetical protein II699_07245 [Lachnospiraceae bacterium]|nr:hypothetical protein [Lachnospiraceae bacterium]